MLLPTVHVSLSKCSTIQRANRHFKSSPCHAVFTGCEFCRTYWNIRTFWDDLTFNFLLDSAIHFFEWPWVWVVGTLKGHWKVHWHFSGKSHLTFQVSATKGGTPRVQHSCQHCQLALLALWLLSKVLGTHPMAPKCGAPSSQSMLGSSGR